MTSWMHFVLGDHAIDLVESDDVACDPIDTRADFAAARVVEMSSGALQEQGSIATCSASRSSRCVIEELASMLAIGFPIARTFVQ